MAKTILIVEDDELNMKLFSDLLRAYGFNTLQSIDGMDCIQIARKHSPDLIIMDIRLPEVSGIEHTKALKADSDLKDIPVIAVTAFAMKGDEEKIMEAGFAAYITKPISVALFLEEIKRFLTLGRFRLTESLMTGHTVVDAEHEQLVVLINKFVDYHEAGDEKASAEKINEFTKTLKIHLVNERRIMEELRCWHLETHKKVHTVGIGKYEALIKDAEHHGYGGSFITELTSILFDDLINADMVLKSHLQNIAYQG